MSGNSISYYVEDTLGTTRAMTTSTGTLGYDADFYPFGVERAPYTHTISQNYKFTGKERDSESGLDNFGARYNSSSMGRFMSPDAFWKDSHVGDPQSWNKYAYARNNPLRYVDPTGENATVSTSCSTDSNNHTTCNVSVTATIAIYAAPGSGLSQDQLNAAATKITNSIDSAWSGSFDQNGVTYNVSTQVSVQVADSAADASKTGAQNVIGLTNGNARSDADSITGPSNSLRTFLKGQDTGLWNFNSLGNDKNVAAHEFGHLLGVGDRDEGALVMNTNLWPVPNRATPADLGWGVKEATQSVGLGLAMKSWYNGSAGPLPSPFRFSTTDQVGAPWGPWWK